MAAAPATTGSGARRVFGNTVLLSAGQGLGLVSMAVWTVAVARYIGPESYGFYAFAQAVVSVLAIFVSLGLDEITTRDVAQHPGRGRRYLGVFAGIKVLASALVLGGFVALSLAGQTTGDEVVVVLVVAAMGAIQTLNSLLSALLFARDAMHLSVAGQSANYLVTMTTGVVAIWLDRSFGTILVLSMTASVVQLVLTFAFARRRLAGVPAERVPADRRELWSTLKRALPFSAVALVSVLHSNMLIILLGTAEYSDAALGQFAAAQRLAMVILIVPSMVAQVLVPALSRAFAEDPDRFAGMFERAYRYVVFLSVPAAVGLAVVAPGLLALVYGAEFARAGETLRVLSLVLLGSATYVLGPALIAMDRQGLVARVHALNLVAVGAVAYLLIPSFGAEGAAWAMVVGAVGSLVFYSRVVFAALRLSFPRAWVTKVVVAGAAACAASVAAGDRLHFAAILLLMVPAVYLAANVALRTLDPLDWAYVRSVVLPQRAPREQGVTPGAAGPRRR